MFIVSAIIFIAVLSVLILAHELGHFIAARKLGVKVEEFGIGFPPRIWAIKKRGVEYSLNWIPLGGFVRMRGQNDFEEVKEREAHLRDPSSFLSKKPWQRLIILSAGVLMNFILGAVLLGVGFMIGLPAAVSEDLGRFGSVADRTVQIVMVEPSSPAETVGLNAGDRIIAVDGVLVQTIADQQTAIKERAGNEITLSIERGSQQLDIQVTPRVEVGPEQGSLGVALAEVGRVSYPWYLAIFKGFQAAGVMALRIVVTFYQLIAAFISGQSVAGAVAGPVGVAVLTSQYAQLGFSYLLQFVAILSINLMIINFLPIPALDGGHLLFLLVEKIRGGKTDRAHHLENIIHLIGFWAILALLGLVTVKEIMKYWNKIIGIF